MALTLFQESGDISHALRPGQKVRVAPAGADRKPTAEATGAVIEEIKPAGQGRLVTLKLEKPTGSAFHPTGLARVWSE